MTRLVMLIAVAFLAARPVMACCLTGHDVTPDETQTAAAPCHDDAATGHQDDAGEGKQQPLTGDCPGCLDCDTAVMQVQSVDDSALLAQSPTEIPLAIMTARFAGFEQKSIVLKTGPPGDPPAVYNTPITLKQRLLI